jgi:hypothetical protein
MTKKEITSKFYAMMQTYIDLIKHAKSNHDFDQQMVYEHKLSAVKATALFTLGAKYYDELDLKQMRYSGQIRPTSK